MRLWGYGMLLVGIVPTVLPMYVWGPELPDEVASHFDLQGQPHGWTSRASLLWTFGGLQLAMPLLLLVVGKLFYVLPPEMISMPNHEYWMEDGRRKYAMRFNEDVMIWIAGLSSLFLTIVFALVVQANLLGDPLDAGVFWAYRRLQTRPEADVDTFDETSSGLHE